MFQYNINEGVVILFLFQPKQTGQNLLELVVYLDWDLQGKWGEINTQREVSEQSSEFEAGNTSLFLLDMTFHCTRGSILPISDQMLNQIIFFLLTMMMSAELFSIFMSLCLYVFMSLSLSQNWQYQRPQQEVRVVSSNKQTGKMRTRPSPTLGVPRRSRTFHEFPSELSKKSPQQYTYLCAAAATTWTREPAACCPERERERDMSKRL